MSTNVRETLPFEVGQFGNFEARMLRNFHAAVGDWDEVCSALGTWESQHLTSDDPSFLNEQHKQWVTELLFWGRFMQQATQQPEFPDKILAGRVTARLRHLEDKLAIWHRELDPAEQARILQAAFK